MGKLKNLIITCGDPAGIGPEVIIKSVSDFAAIANVQFTIIGPAEYFFPLLKVKGRVNKSLVISHPSAIPKEAGVITILDIPAGYIKQGVPSKESGEAALASIHLAHDLVCADPFNSAMITAPISKTAIKEAGSSFPGHTELLAYLAGVNDFVMMFLSDIMKGALLTIHEPLAHVSSLLNPEYVDSKITVIYNTLVEKLHIMKPRIALLGINPHAGENGAIGREEIDIFSDILKRYPFISGPYPADGFFAKQMYKQFDLVVSAYHDQLLIPFKMLAFSDGVNFSAGLPYIRTSPDHGTAYNIAGKNIADHGSMSAALYWALKLLQRR